MSRLVRLLFEAGYTKQKIENLLIFIDNMLMLPKELEQQFQIETTKQLEGEKRMPLTFENSLMAFYMRQDMRQQFLLGQQEGVLIGEREGILKGRLEGERNGENKGILIGERKGKFTGIRNALRKGKLDIAEIAEIFEVPVEEVLEIQEKLLAN